MLAKALKEKGNKSYASGDNIEAMNHYNQALRFATIDQQVVLVLVLVLVDQQVVLVDG